MARYIARRLLASIPVLFGLSLVIFAFLRLLPGDPARTILGQHATPEALARLRLAMGLDRPLHEQYLDYLLGLIRGDLGQSVLNDRPVLGEFLLRFPATIELTLAALLFAIGLGVPLGRLAARHAQRSLDGALTVISLLGISIPVFVLGLTLQYFLSVQWGLFPTGGRIDLRLGVEPVTNFMLIDTVLSGDADAVVDALRRLVLPAVALGSIPLAIITRITRASVLDVTHEDYVRTARAKGLREGRIDGRHIMRNAWLPVTTVIGLQVGALLGGAVITETVFTWNGVGNWVVDAIQNRDYIVIQSSILILALIFLVVNLLVDIGYAFLNPRIRYS